MAIQRRTPRGGLVTTKIPVNNLNSVSTSAANKRQPYEAEVLDNVLVTLERGLEKRPGFEVVPQYTIAALNEWNFSTDATKFNLYTLPDNRDLFYYWYSINSENTYLVVVDFDATGAAEKLFYIYQLTVNGAWKDLTPATQWATDIAAGNATVTAYATANSLTYIQAAALGVVNADSRAYITYGTGTKTAKESLKAVSLGANVMILNTNVSAGFSSDTDGVLYNLNGTKTSPTITDIAGRKLTYYTSAKVIRVKSAGDDTLNATADDIFLGWRPGVLTGIAKSGGINHIDLATSASNADSAYNGMTITITGGTGSGQSKTISSYIGSTRRANVSTNWTTAPDHTSTYSITITGSDHISVDDYFYFESDKAYLGQRVDDLSEIRLPPESDDWYNLNEKTTATTNNHARLMLKELYDVDTELNGIIDGRGKIYYTLNPYLNTTSGYYRVISWNPSDAPSTGFWYDTNKVIYLASAAGRTAVPYTGGRPYLQKIRTPDEHSYIDPRRMPQRLKVTVEDGSVTKWAMEKVKWTARTSGTKDSNPGPSIFKTIDKKDLRHVQIHSIAVFKDRLWFASDDVVFSSQMGEYENLFLDDPTNIVTTDPIDIRVSSNNFAEITSMVPFEDYLFIDTKANSQFQLAPASGTELSPTNVAVAPVTFYSTAPIGDPQLIGSRLYFFGPQRLYLFVGKNAMGYSSAVETSSPAAGYLPTNYRDICTAPAQDSIVMLSNDDPTQMYLYTSRFSAERVIQSSFYRYLVDGNMFEIKAIKSFNNYLYAVVYLTTVNTYVLLRSKLMSESNEVPRLDGMLKLKLRRAETTPSTIYPNVLYDSATGITTIRIPNLGYPSSLGPSETCRVVLDSTWGIQAGTVLQPVSKGPAGNYFEAELFGDYRPPLNGDIRYIYFGINYEMRITLSTLFVRDENNNIIDGVLNIRSGVLRHFNTGNYDVEVTHRGRTALVSKFSAAMVDLTSGEDTIPLETIDNQGEFVAKIFGYSDTTTISLVSSYTTPCNITNMEFKGKFKQKYSSLN